MLQVFANMICACLLLLYRVNEAPAAPENQEALILNIVTAHEKLREEFAATEVIEKFDEWPSPHSNAKHSRLMTSLRRGEDLLVKSANDVKAANSEYEFHIKRKDPESDWQISEVKARSPSSAAYPTLISLAIARSSFAPFLKANHFPMAELLTHPAAHVTSVSDVELEGRTLKNIQIAVNDRKALLESGLEIRFVSVSLYFPAEPTHWIPVRMELRGILNDGFDTTLSNFTLVEGTEIPIQFKSIGRLDDGTEWLFNEGTYEFGFDEVPEDVFYLSYYGLPEPDFGSNVPTPYRAVIGIVLTAGIVIALIFLWRRSNAHS